jgi:uncharacterized protein YkvS
MESLSKEEKTLMDKYYDVLKAEGLKNGKELSELYYKVKKDGSNPELVKQVDEFLLEVKKLQSAPVVTDAKPSEIVTKSAVDSDIQDVLNAKNKEELTEAGLKLINIDPYSQAVSMGVRSNLLTPGMFEKGKQLFLEEVKDAVEQRRKLEETKPVSPTAPAEKTGSEKAQELIDSVSSIKDLPDLSKADSGPITIDLTELISTGQAKSKDINQMLNKKRAELLQNISTKDLQKGDIVTFVDGRKGFVRSVGNNEVSIKVTGSQQGVVEVVPANDLSKTISNIESGKVVSMEPTPDIEVAPQEITEVKASQDAKSAFTENTAAVKEAAEKAAKAAGTNNQQNLNNLLQNIGCKTGK